MARIRCRECGKKFSDIAGECPSCGKSARKRASLSCRALPLVSSFLVGAAVAFLVDHWVSWRPRALGQFLQRSSDEKSGSVSSSRKGLSYGDLLTFAHSPSQSLDVAEANLLCAHGLPGVGDLRIPECLATIDKWSEQIRKQTRRRHSEYEQTPERFANSEARFRLSVLADVLRKDYGLYYDYPPLIQQPTSLMSPPMGSPFQNPRNVFIHGVLLKETPPTSPTLTVIVAALGRRQGYPLKLATARTHSFVRWDDGKERFNIEVTSRGLMVFPDETYRDVCMKGLNPTEQQAYMESFSPAREIAVFLSRRAACLAANGKLIDAEVCWAHAWELDPRQEMTAATLRGVVHEERVAMKETAPITSPPGAGTPSSDATENDLPIYGNDNFRPDTGRRF